LVTKDLVQNKLKHLCELVEKTEPKDFFKESHELFTSGQMDCYSMMVMVDEEWDKLSREEVREVMERSNQIWKERKWIESGKVDSLEEAKYRGLITDYLKRGEKINAIKVYRTNTSSSLKEAKDYVDALQEVLIKEGTLPK
jgi:ribosomal protein L7/L12